MTTIICTVLWWPDLRLYGVDSLHEWIWELKDTYTNAQKDCSSINIQQCDVRAAHEGFHFAVQLSCYDMSDSPRWWDNQHYGGQRLLEIVCTRAVRPYPSSGTWSCCMVAASAVINEDPCNMHKAIQNVAVTNINLEQRSIMSATYKCFCIFHTWYVHIHCTKVEWSFCSCDLLFKFAVVFQSIWSTIYAFANYLVIICVYST